MKTKGKKIILKLYTLKHRRLLPSHLTCERVIQSKLIYTRKVKHNKYNSE